MTSARQGQVEIHTDVTPDAIWSLVANLDRMGEWSPECYRVIWLDGASAPARVGARFKGKNRWGPVRWSMTCEVKTAEPGREISWSTVQRGRDVVTWRYQFEPEGEGTRIVESFEVHSLPLSARLFEDVLMVNRDAHREAAMRATLERINAAAVAPVDR
jgi:carbon monoxide dehydrogenase subunit G